METVPVAGAGQTGTAASGAVAAAVAASIDWPRALPAMLAASDRLTLLAQPIVDLATGVVAGYELLSRFRGQPSAPPDVWFAEADRRGYAATLTTRVVERALLARPHLPAGTFLTVNVEPHLLCEPVVRAALRDWGRLDRVVFELTASAPPAEEGTLAEDRDAARDAARDGTLTAEGLLRGTLEEIRSQGALVAVDDVGTGYAGLQQLLRIRPDFIKLDRDLIGGLDTDQARRAVVRLLVDLGGRMGAWLVAEGVETAGELQALAELGVPLAQGWLLGRPAPQWPAMDSTLAPRSARVASGAGHRDTIAHLVRVAAVAPVDAPDAVRSSGTVLVDAAGRPVTVLYRDGTGGVQCAPAVTVGSSARLADVARRAMNRPVEHRGVPLVCTDTWGLPAGTIDVADLVEELATTAGP